MPDVPAPPALLHLFPQTPEARLRLALRRLDEALAEQAEAVALFRREMSNLGASMRGLEDQTLAYRDALAGTAAEVARAHAASLALMDTAAKMTARM